LVVDDTPANLKLLVAMLKERGYKPRPAVSGALALAAALQSPPDLILLDIHMPEMDGYEVCRRIKADSRLQEIPILFISALNETMDKVKAFSVGGLDYITKPFQSDEIEARIRTHLELRSRSRQLKERYEHLQRLEALRDNLTQMIVHDIRSPLFVVKSALALLKPCLPAKDHESADIMRAADESLSILSEMTSSLLDIGRLEAGQMPIQKTRQNLAETARKACDMFAYSAAEKHLLLVAPEPVTATYDEDLVRRVIGNLLGNALKFSAKKGQVKITVTREGNLARAAITDCGPGIAPQFHEKIFEKYGQVEGEQKKYGVGLGLNFCKLAVAAHGGRIGLESAVGQGSTFWFTLP